MLFFLLKDDNDGNDPVSSVVLKIPCWGYFFVIFDLIRYSSAILVLKIS